MNCFRTALPVLFLATIACSEAEDTSADWWEDWDDTASDTDTDMTDTDGKDDTDGKGGGTDTGKYDDVYPDCASDFDPTETCEGDWKETICMYEGKIYWCDGGQWKNEDEK